MHFLHNELQFNGELELIKQILVVFWVEFYRAEVRKSVWKHLGNSFLCLCSFLYRTALRFELPYFCMLCACMQFVIMSKKWVKKTPNECVCTRSTLWNNNNKKCIRFSLATNFSWFFKNTHNDNKQKICIFFLKYMKVNANTQWKQYENNNTMITKKEHSNGSSSMEKTQQNGQQKNMNMNVPMDT